MEGPSGGIGAVERMINPLSDDLAEVREVWRGAIQKAKRTKAYKHLLNRRFRNPQGYLEWERCAAELAAVIDLSASQYDDLPSPAKALTAITAGFCHDQGPIYWLRETLAQALWHSDLPPQLPALEQSIQRAILLLPQVNWLADPDGFMPRYVAVQHLLSGQTLSSVPLGNFRIQLAVPDQDYIQWGTPLPTGGAYAQSSALMGNELDTESEEGEWQDPASSPTDAEHRWLVRMTHLVYQCLLLLQLKPDFIDTSSTVSPTGKPQRKLTKKKRLLNPRWLGAGFEIKTTTTKGTGGGSHASPMTHWRRGHWKRVAVGEGRKMRKIVWIQPTLVNP